MHASILAVHHAVSALPGPVPQEAGHFDVLWGHFEISFGLHVLMSTDASIWWCNIHCIEKGKISRQALLSQVISVRCVQNAYGYVVMLTTKSGVQHDPHTPHDPTCIVATTQRSLCHNEVPTQLQSCSPYISCSAYHFLYPPSFCPFASFCADSAAVLLPTSNAERFSNEGVAQRGVKPPNFWREGICLRAGAALSRVGHWYQDFGHCITDVSCLR